MQISPISICCPGSWCRPLATTTARIANVAGRCHAWRLSTAHLLTVKNNQQPFYLPIQNGDTLATSAVCLGLKNDSWKQ